MWVYSLVMGKESNSLKTAFRKINTSVRNADFFNFFFLQIIIYFLYCCLVLI